MTDTDQDHQYVGKPVLSVDGARLLTGGGTYGDDFERPGQLHAVIVRSEIAHGRILSIDTSVALAMPGVELVITAAELPDVKIPVRLLPSENAEKVLQPPLARDRVRYVGEPLAVVLAENPYLAEDAAAEILVELDPLPVVTSTEQALAEDAIRIHESLDGNEIDRHTLIKGDSFEAACAGAAAVVGCPIHVQRHGAAPMETRALLADWDPEAEMLSLWGAAKVKHFNRNILANLLGLPNSQVRLIEGDVGGGFGPRGEFYPEDFLMPWLAIETGRPVKWSEDRRENLIALNHSREQDWQIEIAVAADGELLGMRARGDFNQGAYARTHGGRLLPGLSMNHLVGPYRWRSFDIVTRSVLSNKTPAGTYRGPGQYEATYARERVLEMAADAIGLDPADLRRRNLVTAEEMPYPATIIEFGSGREVNLEGSNYPVVFENLIDKADYTGLREQVNARRAAGELVGLGIAAFIEMGNPGPFEQATVKAGADGTFELQVGVASVGQGVGTSLAQVAAQTLDVPIERVTVGYHDTSVAPDGLGAFSSRGTIMGGRAIIQAIDDLKKNALDLAADHLEASRGDLRISGDRIHVVGAADGPSVTYGELDAGGHARFESEHTSDMMMGANLAVVAVDRESGNVKIERFALSYDIGRIVNPLALNGQMVGAAAQGIGGALLEEFAYSEDGQPLATSFMDYAMPTADEIPPIDIYLLSLAESTEADAITGAKGGGEGGIVAAGAVLANAVADALGPSSAIATHLPIRPEDILSALNSSRGNSPPG